MQAAERELRALLDGNALTQGMTLRLRGSHLYAGREEAPGPFSDGEEPDERLRFSRIGARFGLSIMRHTGKWEKTPFAGTLEELVQAVCATMQHLVAAP